MQAAGQQQAPWNWRFEPAEPAEPGARGYSWPMSADDWFGEKVG